MGLDLTITRGLLKSYLVMIFNMYNNLDTVYSDLENILKSSVGGEQFDPHTQVSCMRSMIFQNHI